MEAWVNEEAARPGRQAKRAVILDAAGRLFFSRGFEGVTIEAVAAAAVVSKVTVYSHFGDKLGLFEAVVRHRTSHVADALAAFEAAEAPLPEALNAVGVQLLGFVSRPEVVNLDRMLAAEAARHPELARRFMEAAPGRMRQALANLIAAGARRGEVAVDDPVLAAEDLVGLWQGMHATEVRLGLRPPPTPEGLRERVARGVRLFLRAHAPDAAVDEAARR